MGHDGRVRGIVALCGMWGRVTKRKFGGIWNSFKKFGRCRTSLGEWKRGMEKEICTLCVILIKDG